MPSMICGVNLCRLHGAQYLVTRALSTCINILPGAHSLSQNTFLSTPTHQPHVYKTSHRHQSSSSDVQEQITPTSTDPLSIQSGVLANINQQINDRDHGRLFAVIHFCGKQVKVTAEDILLVHANRHFPDVGQRICINKVLLVGSKDFTMIGRPLLQDVRVEATVVEKTLSHPKIWFNYKKRESWQNTRLVQDFRTILRINSIEIETQVD